MEQDAYDIRQNENHLFKEAISDCRWEAFTFFRRSWPKEQCKWRFRWEQCR